jgi:hypothetical protein
MFCGTRIDIKGSTVVEGELDLTRGDLKVVGTTEFEEISADNLTTTGNVTSPGNVQAQDVIATRDASVGQDLTVQGNSSVGQDLTVDGNLTVNGSVKQFFWYGPGALSNTQSGNDRYWQAYGNTTSTGNLGVTLNGSYVEMPSSYVLDSGSNNDMVNDLTPDGIKHGFSPNEAGWYHIDYYATYHERFGNSLSYPRLFLKLDRLYRVDFVGSSNVTGFEVAKVKSSTVAYMTPDIGVCLLAKFNNNVVVRWGYMYIKITKLF